MSSVATPTGAQPVGTLSASGSYSGKVRHLPIASGYATAIFSGDFVTLLAVSGTVVKDTGTTTLTPVGVFMGCFYTDPNTKQPTYSAYWPASTVAADAVAYVVDDPNILMQMQGNASITQNELGANFAVVQTAGSTAIGRSKNSVNASTAATTATLPLRLIDFVDGPDSVVADAYTDVIVKFNVGHLYTNTTGQALS